MAELQYSGGKIALDDEGFLVDSEQWSEEVAKALAKKEEVADLTDDQMAIVKFMREYYNKFHAFPILNYVCKNLHQPRECVQEEFINPIKAWKIAGLPKPTGVHFVSVDNKQKTYILEECC